MSEPTALELFDRWHAKRRCRRVGPQRTAHILWRSLEPHLTEDERRALRTAASHLFHDGANPAELDSTAARVRIRLAAR